MAANGDRALPGHEQTTPTPSRPDRANGPATGGRWRIDKPSARTLAVTVLPAKAMTTVPRIAGGSVDRVLALPCTQEEWDEHTRSHRRSRR
jgi:hypothetical protein